MPGKPKRKGKHPPSKKSKSIMRQGAPVPVEESEPAAAVARPSERPAVRPVAARPVAPAKSSEPAPASAARYPHFVPELKRIGILAAIIVVVLIVLSFVLS